MARKLGELIPLWIMLAIVGLTLLPRLQAQGEHSTMNHNIGLA
jgi:hypothetical protein